MQSPLLITEKGLEVVGRFHCPARKVTETFHFVVDTGSSTTYLGWHDATRARIDFDSLPGSPKPVFGFGGSGTDVKHLPEQCFFYIPFETGGLEEVQLPEGILIYRPARTKTKNWKTEGSVSLIGRDFLRVSGWRLIVDLAGNRAYFEKS